MKIILLIIRKFLASAKDKSYISKLSFFSYVLVGLGVAVPILVLSVTNGFQNVVEQRIVNYDFHLQVFFPELTQYDRIESLQGLESWGFYEDKCLIKSNYTSKVTQIRAFRKKDMHESNFFATYKILAGSMYAGTGGIILAENLASNLRVGIGDDVELIVIDNSIGYNSFSQRKFRVDGIVSLGYAPFDVSASFLLKSDADGLFLLQPETINKIGLHSLSRKYREHSSLWLDRLREIYPGQVVSNTFDNKVFKDFAEEKKSLTIAMFVIMLIAFIAIFITLNVVLADKTVDVGLLKVIGVTNRALMQTFLGQGVFIAFVGAIAGLFLGSLVVINLDLIIRAFEYLMNNFFYLTNLAGITDFPAYYRFEIMPQEVFYLSSLPYELLWRDFVIQGIGAFIFAIIASYSPAFKVLKADPAATLRNE